MNQDHDVILVKRLVPKQKLRGGEFDGMMLPLARVVLWRLALPTMQVIGAGQDFK